MVDNVLVVPLAAFQAMIGPRCNPFLSIVVSGGLKLKKLHFSVTVFADAVPHDRVLSAIDYLKHLYDVISLTSALSEQEFRFVFQAEDVPVDVTSASWETMTSWNTVTLIPDLYYFQAKGYEDTSPVDISWGDRDSKIVWRGSTTGLFHQHLEDLDLLSRYQMCQIVSRFGSFADVGLNAVVQAADPGQEGLIKDRLMSEGLFKPFLPMTDMARCRYILDIDGNSNSWNFMMKLRLGCCVLRVGSDWHQWFMPRLLPWVHFVPIGKDLTDTESKINWCLENAAECAEIAKCGTAFAREMRFDEEMVTAAASLYQVH